MALGDGIRRNIAHVTEEERDRFRDAVVQLNNRYYPDGISKWVKQDQIHEATHVHEVPSFLPWHRELCNRFEQLLREFDPDLSLHYWNWTEDPRAASDGNGGIVNLLDEGFMGTGSGTVGVPFAGFPPFSRNVAGGDAPPSPPGVDSDAEIINSTNGLSPNAQWNVIRAKIQSSPNHNSVHTYIGGNIGSPHTAFEDPFIFLLHSNVDRLWGMWQTVPGEEWRLDPELTYGDGSNHPNIIENLEPWAGGSGLRPWAPPDNQQVVKNSKHPSVVGPPCYDTMPTFVPILEVVNPGNVINFNDVPEGETTARATSFRIYGCRDVDLRVKPGTEPSNPFSILTPSGQVTAFHEPGEFIEARIWFGFTGQTPSTSEPSQNVTIEVVGENKEFDFTLKGNSIEREEVAVVLALDQSGSMDAPAGTTGAKRLDLLKESATEFINLIQTNNGVGLVRFDHDAYAVNDATYPGFPVTRITTDNAFDPDRIAARGAVGAHATNLNGWTSIGDGVLMARNTINPVTGYDRKVLIVFTDGVENRPLKIADVMSSIDDRTFAIGLGNAQQVSTAALNALTAGTGGYLLLTDHLSASLDDYFLLTKYFFQILASATNTDIIVDPNGFIGPKMKLRLPFELDESDIICTAILLHELPVVQFSLEAPNGNVITPATVSVGGGVFNGGSRMSYYRFMLPTVAGGHNVHGGRWHALLEVDSKLFRRRLGLFKNDREALSRLQAHGVRYSFNVHSYSNLRMESRVAQNSLEPGAEISIRALLREYGIPVDHRAHVRAEVRRPDNTVGWIELSELEPGVFEGVTEAKLAGVYRFRVMAAGRTLKGRPFTREQLLTGAALPGGDGPFPFDGRDLNGDREDFCRLVECLIEEGALKHFFERNEIDPDALRRCLRQYCVEDDPHRRRQPALEEISPKMIANLVNDRRFVDAILNVTHGRRTPCDLTP